MPIAFKEWALVCEALGSGEQSLLLRKGGIAEGKGGFGFDHDKFYLFPTWFHGQVEKIRKADVALPDKAPDHVTLSYAAHLEWSGRIDDKKTAHRLRELHVLDASVIEERFFYDTGSRSLGGNGINVAFVRVYRLEPTTTLPLTKELGGCRSWVELPERDFGTMVSVLSDEEHQHRKELFGRLLGLTF